MREEDKKLYFELYRIERTKKYIEQYDRIKAWNKLQKEIRQRTVKRFYIHSSIAATVFLLISLPFFIFSIFSKSDSNGLFNTHVTQCSYAELIMANGDKIRLINNENYIILSDSISLIETNNNTLIYNVHSDETLQYNTLVTPLGAEYKLILSDGTKVYLNAGSELRFPTSFNEKTREVFLSGEAFFYVNANENHPFMVNTSEQKIMVLGTSFNVKDYPTHNITATTLASGKLRILCSDNSYEILPGTQVTYNKKKGISEKKDVDIELFTSWKDGYYYFEQTTLEDIMTNLSLWYNLEVNYNDDYVKNICFSGQLSRYDDVSYLLNKMEETNDVRFIINGNKIIVTKK